MTILAHDPDHRVICVTCGDQVGEYPQKIAVELTEDEIVTLQRVLQVEQHDRPSPPLLDLQLKLRAYQMTAFARWHG